MNPGAAVQVVALSASLLLLTGCDDWMPGKPSKSHEYVPYTENANFDELYAQNCMACHSDGTSFSASLPMNNPLYLELIPEDKLRSAIANGVDGTAMPPFAMDQGGPLTDKQVDILAKGILEKWAKPGDFKDVQLPAYSGPLGDAAAGAQVFAAHCASCHGQDGKGGPDGGSVVDPSYLALVSDQWLRTVVIVGRPEFGMPDWRGKMGDNPMSDADISNVVAWMASHRNQLWIKEAAAGQPKQETAAPAPDETQPAQPDTPAETETGDTPAADPGQDNAPTESAS